MWNGGQEGGVKGQQCVTMVGLDIVDQQALEATEQLNVKTR